jgi:hypothetical protein
MADVRNLDQGLSILQKGDMITFFLVLKMGQPQRAGRLNVH